MRRRLQLALGAGILATMAAAGAASAHEPTCADFEVLGIGVHGQHVVRDYVAGSGLAQWPPAGGLGEIVGGNGAALPGGPGPAFHFANGFAPGASFCLPQSQAPGYHAGD
jgi:hypothetical protein